MSDDDDAANDQNIDGVKNMRWLVPAEIDWAWTAHWFHL